MWYCSPQLVVRFPCSGKVVAKEEERVKVANWRFNVQASSIKPQAVARTERKSQEPRSLSYLVTGVWSTSCFDRIKLRRLSEAACPKPFGDCFRPCGLD